MPNSWMLLSVLLTAAGTVLVLTVLYWVVRAGVRDGMRDAERRSEAARVRAGLGVGAERSPNSRS